MLKTRGMDETVGLDDKTVNDALEGTLPWLVPAGLATEALTALDRPLLAWIQDPEYNEFDSADFYAEHREAGDKLSKLEKRIAKLPVRQSWWMERVWTPDEESSAAYDTAYEKTAVTIGDRRLHPRDLDAYTTIAYEVAGLHQGDEDGLDDEDDDQGDLPGDLDLALEWARAGVGPRRSVRPPAVPALAVPRRPALRRARQPPRPPHPLLLRRPAAPPRPEGGRAVVHRAGLPQPERQPRRPVHRPRRSPVPRLLKRIAPSRCRAFGHRRLHARHVLCLTAAGPGLQSGSPARSVGGVSSPTWAGSSARGAAWRG
ncbi:hypothetical protein GCM10010441_18030 [Kitasatospora paracochleata]